MTSYAVIGSGAIGGFYGARLARSGQEVHFLFRHDAEFVRENGLQIASPAGDFVIKPVLVHETIETIPKVDVVLVAVKSLVNMTVAPQISGLLKPGGAVLLIQNGIGGEQEYAEELADDVELFGGLAFVSTTVTGPGQVQHLDHGELTIGRYVDDYSVSPVTPKMTALAADLEAAEVAMTLTDDLLAARWQKLLWNIPFNGLSVVLNAMTTELLEDDGTEALIAQIMNEVEAGARADDRELVPGMIELLIEGTKAMRPYATSMKVDFDAGRRLEVEALLGNPYRRALDRGVELSRIGMLYEQLRFVDDRIAAP